MSYRYIIAFSFIIGVCIILDLYTWHGLKRTLEPKIFNFFKWFIPISTLLFFFGFIANIYRSGQGIYNANYLLNIMVGFTFGIFLAKLLIATPFLLEDLFRYGKFVVQKISNWKSNEQVSLDSRRVFIRNLALTLAAIPFTGTLYAITRGKYNFQVVHKKLTFKDLPESFKGFKIVQFTDFHAGSFDDHEQVKKGLSLINDQNPDLVVFTGDLVNNRAEECLPYVSDLANIKSKYGKFSIMGNHDYGEYMPFATEEDKIANKELLRKIYVDSDFKLLSNESIAIEKENQKIHLLGVENWGNPPFPQYGDLKAASKGLSDSDFKILLSHDPDHWELETRHFSTPIHLTLSGHTHGAQFGIDIPNWKWSPVKYRYKRWLGHYEHENKHLYISKGFGFLGFPGRIGMSPEIVVFELEKG